MPTRKVKVVKKTKNKSKQSIKVTVNVNSNNKKRGKQAVARPQQAQAPVINVSVPYGETKPTYAQQPIHNAFSEYMQLMRQPNYNVSEPPRRAPEPPPPNTALFSTASTPQVPVVSPIARVTRAPTIKAEPTSVSIVEAMQQDRNYKLGKALEEARRKALEHQIDTAS